MKVTKLISALAFSVVAVTVCACAQTTVFVPGNASGYFGSPAYGVVPMLPAITVSGASTITITYVSGTVDFGIGIEVGPNGGVYPGTGNQYPLQEAKGIANMAKIDNMAALIGVFVPQSRTQMKGFTALDGTKNVVTAGIMPDGIFFIGEGKTITVKEAGTLFLGINDSGVVDNSGGFTMQVSTTSAGK